MCLLHRNSGVSGWMGAASLLPTQPFRQYHSVTGRGESVFHPRWQAPKLSRHIPEVAFDVLYGTTGQLRCKANVLHAESGGLWLH